MSERVAVGRSDETGSGFFVIADISGYTRFLAANELAHAQGILAELTQLLIDRLSAPFRFVELEVDAVFVFAPDVAVEDSERLVDIMAVCYAAFRLRREQMVANTTCECSACRAIPAFDLKLVAHFGRYVPQKRLKLRLARPLIGRQWQSHFAALNRLVLEDGARADAVCRVASS